jgi:hypothetical protein
MRDRAALASVPGMPEPSFRFVCVPPALAGSPGSWAREMLRDGEIALLPDAGGLESVSAVAHELGLISVVVIREEVSPQRQAATVMEHADGLPLVWVADAFGDQVESWARDRGPMTLLVHADGPLAEDERRRIDRFVATLGRQSE